MSEDGMTRRQFVKRASAAATAGLLLGGCMPYRTGLVNLVDGETRVDAANGYPPDSVLLGLYTPALAADPQVAVRAACQYLDWSWLSPGDSVFVKLACNSGNRHPAVTSPNAVLAVVREVLDRGAGRVVVGDQGGVEDVKTTKSGRSGSTRKLTAANGLYQAIVESGAEPYFFDDQDYEGGFFEADMPFDDHHWPRSPYLAEIIREVDHVIYLPRLSSHVIAGYSHGHKIAVGWLRTDSRYAMHLDAPNLDKRYVELSYVSDVRDRLRLTITLAERVLLDVGPNEGTIAEPDAWIVIASSHLANHDVVSVAALAYIDRAMPESMRVIRASKEYQNGMGSDPALLRAYEILGSVPSSIPARLLGHEPCAALRASLESHDHGILDWGGGS